MGRCGIDTAASETAGFIGLCRSGVRRLNLHTYGAVNMEKGQKATDCRVNVNFIHIVLQDFLTCHLVHFPSSMQYFDLCDTQRQQGMHSYKETISHLYYIPSK